MCKKMYNELCEICQKAADCTVDYNSVTFDASILSYALIPSTAEYLMTLRL